MSFYNVVTMYKQEVFSLFIYIGRWHWLKIKYHAYIYRHVAAHNELNHCDCNKINNKALFSLRMFLWPVGPSL